MAEEINYNGAMISWAIARAGGKLEDYMDSFPKLKEWIDKTKIPTLKQLENLSKKLHVPFGYLLMANPPSETIPFPFFRSQGNNTTQVSLNLYDIILLIQRRQDWLRDYLQDNDYKALDFVGLFNKTSGTDLIVAEIRKRLGLVDEWACNFTSVEECINYLTEKIEDLGVIAIFNGVVENSNLRSLNVKECRGFVLVDKYAPFMFINNTDGKAAQLFTLMHELAHIFVGESAGFDYGNLLPANSPLENKCDEVAAEFLVPRAAFLRRWNSDPKIEILARYFKVSRIVIARRALDLGKITKAEFFRLYRSYELEVQKKKDNQGDGGNFYATQKKRVSARFAGFIDQAVKLEKLLYRDAYKLTGLRGETFDKFISQTLQP